MTIEPFTAKRARFSWWELSCGRIRLAGAIEHGEIRLAEADGHGGIRPVEAANRVGVCPAEAPGMARFARQQPSSAARIAQRESSPPPECGKIRSVGVTPPGGEVARSAQWKSLSMSRFAQQEPPRGGEGWQDLLAMHDLRGLDGKRAS